jgi:CRISPR-associated endoribonuclease Cas6
VRLVIRFRPVNGKLVLPLNYEEVLQGFLYCSIEDIGLAHFLHNVGYRKEKRQFKLFTFSRLEGSYKLHHQSRKIEFFDQVTWHISSVLNDLIFDLAKSFLLKANFMLNNQQIQIEEATVQEFFISEQQTYKIKMLSPLTVYSTYKNIHGEKRTQFFSPQDIVFSDMIERNFHNKFEAYFQTEPDERISIKPLKITKKDKVVTQFKGFRINAWNGIYEIQAPLSYIRFMYDVGIGARNSQGFGLFELVQT